MSKQTFANLDATGACASAPVFCLLFERRFWFASYEQTTTIAGSLCMVSAHLWNRHKFKCCETSQRCAQSAARHRT